jgi:hypothetical protein
LRANEIEILKIRKEIAMKTCLYLAVLCGCSMPLIAAEAAEKAAEKPAVEAVETPISELIGEEVQFEDIKLPPKESPDYWVIRSDAVTELTRLLTSKRAEMKQIRQMLADYLLKIGKAEEMASKNIEVPDDPKLYFEALGLEHLYKDKDLDAPLKTPTWEALAEFAMRFIIYEGHVPMQFDGPEDVASYIQVAKKKEQYAQKVRREMRGYVKDSLEIWIYLGQIGQQAAFEEWEVQMKVDSEKAKSAEHAALAEQRRMVALDRKESVKERKFEDAQQRASFSSTRRSRNYQSRDNLLRYRQSRLDERYTNSYRW